MVVNAFFSKHLVQNLSSPVSGFSVLRERKKMGVYEARVTAKAKSHHDSTG